MSMSLSFSEATTPFSHVFTTKNNQKIMLCDMTIEDIDDVVKFLADNFTSFTSAFYHLKVTPADASPYFKRIVERSVSENMAVKAYDMDTGKLIAAIISYDVYNMQINPIDLTGLSPILYNIINMHRKFSVKFYPKKPGVIVNGAFLTIHQDYLGSNLLARFEKILFGKHPLLSMYPLAIGQLISPRSINVFKSAFTPETARVIGSFHPKDYINEKGERPFEGIDDTAKKIGLRGYQGVYSVINDYFLRSKLQGFSSIR